MKPPADNATGYVLKHKSIDEGLLQLQFAISQDTTTPRELVPSPPRRPLHEETCLRLCSWLDDPPAQSPSIMWLSGLSDPSSLLEISKLCESKHMLAGLFCFTSRKGVEQMKQLVPSLAYQIASNIPKFRERIGLAVSQDPSISSQPFQLQFQKLLLNPFRDVPSTGHPTPRSVIIVDGLQLYHDRRTQEEVVSAIELTVTSTQLPFRVLFTSHGGTDRDYTPPLHIGTHIHVHDCISSTRFQEKSRHKTSPSPNDQPEFGFPKLLQTHYSIGRAESYARSLMMLGHGFPLWFPQGDMGVSPAYIKQGIHIGDVLSINGSGLYRFCFNILRQHNDPIHLGYVEPSDFEPIDAALDPSEVMYTENYFPPGTVITSSGVDATIMTTSPLSVNFQSRSQEGAALILPDGASREDLVSTDRIYDHVKKWAPYWYRDRMVPNGSLLVVTGCDKTSDYGALCFPKNSPSCSKASPPIDADYVNDKVHFNPWAKTGGDVYGVFHNRRLYQDMSGEPWVEGRSSLCVFVRGLRIALGEGNWASGTSQRSSRIATQNFYSNVLHKPPALDRAAASVLVCLRQRMSNTKALYYISSKAQQLFHPIFVLAPIMLRKYPHASVAIVDDSIWCPLVIKEYGTFEAINSLVDRIFQHFTIIERDGVISLQKMSDIEATSALRLPTNHHINRWAKLFPIGRFVKPPVIEDSEII